MNSIEKVKLKILICDLDTRLLSRLKIWIKAMGITPILTDDAIVAQRIIEEEKPDIVLMSNNIKHKGSIECISDIRKLFSNIKLIVMLDEDMNADEIKKYIDLEVDRFLNKPIDSELLFKSVDNLAKIIYNELHVDDE